MPPQPQDQGLTRRRRRPCSSNVFLVLGMAASVTTAFRPPIAPLSASSFSASGTFKGSTSNGLLMAALPSRRQRCPSRTSLSMHMAPSHGLSGDASHSHGHDEHRLDHHHPPAKVGLKGLVSYLITVLQKKKQTIFGVLLGAIAVVAVRSYKGLRKFSSADVGILGLVATFLLAVESTKSYLTALRENLSSLAAGWRAHRSLQLLQSDRPLAAGGPAVSNLRAGAKEADRVTWLGIYANLALFAIKASAGVVGRSAAMIADAGHTLSDLVSDMVTLWAVRMSALPPDDDHPYGHGRFEAVGSLGVSALLLLTAWHIAAHAYDKLQCTLLLPSLGPFPFVSTLPAVILSVPWMQGLFARGGQMAATCAAAPSAFAVGAALASIVVKELLYQVTASVGLKHNSQVLLANAWHHRSDAISSVMALGGIVAARAGLAALDPVAGILVTAMIGLTGMQIFLDSMNQLTDTVESDSIPQIRRVAATVEGVRETSNVRARRMGPQLLVDLRILVDSEISASAAQQVADQVRWRIRRDFPNVSEVLVSTKTELLPCPLTNELRQPSEIEADVRTLLGPEWARQEPLVSAVRKVVVHYSSMAPTVDVLLQIDPELSVREAGEVARRVQVLVEGVKDVTRAEIHMDLTSTGSPATAVLHSPGEGGGGGVKEEEEEDQRIDGYRCDVCTCRWSGYSCACVCVVVVVAVAVVLVVVVSILLMYNLPFVRVQVKNRRSVEVNCRPVSRLWLWWCACYEGGKMKVKTKERV